MTEVVFIEKENSPTDKQLKDVLGKPYVHFDKLLGLTKQFMQEWKFYGKKYGWQMKVCEKKKALFYLVPYNNFFLYGMALRENDKELLLKSTVSDWVKTELTQAEKIMEGYPLRKQIKTKKDFDVIVEVLKALGKI